MVLHRRDRCWSSWPWSWSGIGCVVAISRRCQAQWTGSLGIDIGCPSRHRVVAIVRSSSGTGWVTVVSHHHGRQWGHWSLLSGMRPSSLVVGERVGANLVVFGQYHRALKCTSTSKPPSVSSRRHRLTLCSGHMGRKPCSLPRHLALAPSHRHTTLAPCCPCPSSST